MSHGSNRIPDKRNEKREGERERGKRREGKIRRSETGKKGRKESLL